MNCEAYTEYQTLDDTRQIIRGSGNTPEAAIDDAAQNGYPECAGVIIDGDPCYQEDGRWFPIDQS